MKRGFLWVSAASCLLFLGELLLIGQASALSASVSYDGAEGVTARSGSFVPVNVSQNRPTYCSSIENTCTLCWDAVDGKPTTRWSSQFSDPQWITIDLGAPTRIDRVILRWETAFARAYQIQVSNDVVAWTTVHSTSDGDGGVDDLVVTGSGRYVRMFGTQRATGWGYSLFEFEVFGISSKVNLPLVVDQPFHVPSPTPTPIATPRPIRILVDDFSPQPEPGHSLYSYNRLDGDRGAVNDSLVMWGSGLVTATIAPGKTWGGGWASLNHPIREQLPIDFAALLPPQIEPQYQSQITGITARVAHGTPGRTFRLEIKNRGLWQWSSQVTLDGGEQNVSFDLPALGDANELVWVLNGAPGDEVVLDSITFTATTHIRDTAIAAFVWGYGQLLSNWDPQTGLVRDRAEAASGEFDAVQATGSLAAATAQAAQLGVISQDEAVDIVNTIGNTVLVQMPRNHGLLPHFVQVSPGGAITIAPDTEWSTIDTAITAIALLTAQSGLGLDTTATEQLLRDIDWEDLVKPTGFSMGYGCGGNGVCPILDVFGAESWLVELAYASATGHVAPLVRPSPPTVNGAGFIDEMHFLFVPPPVRHDYWGTNWPAVRLAAAERQIRYYPSNYPASCFAILDLFGLSSAEVPDPSRVSSGNVYQAFGVGGRDRCANDGSTLLGAPVVVPHYSALIAALRPDKVIPMWDWLITNGLFTPLNNVESMMFEPGAPCDTSGVVWNHRKLSWNLALAVLGWGNYLAQQQEQMPVVWQATTENTMLRDGYRLLVPAQ